MKAKEYLGQAFRIDQRINSKIEQVSSLHSLAIKATSTLSDMPGSATRNTHRMEDIIVKIVDMEQEISCDIDRLVNLKQEITQVIHKVENLEYQTLLELRYMCFKTWEHIAVEMGYGIDNIYKMHKKAMAEIRIPATLQ
ncbi:MAG: DUF1492 domain-containing protein [Clostridia bacterium]|nr:DUF1492 domain-containing protein [Clostridia bacterium]